MAIDLGISNEELREQVIERASDKIVAHLTGGTGEGYAMRPFVDIITKTAERVAKECAKKTVEPLVKGAIETVVFQRTNQWGEIKEQGLSWKEFLEKTTKDYLTEMVSYDGKPKGADSFSWHPHQSRITHIVHQHLSFEIERHLKRAVETVNESLAVGLRETVNIKLAEISKGLSVAVKVK